MSLEKLSTAAFNTDDTRRSPEAIKGDIERELRNRVPERASFFQAELLGLKTPGGKDPVPSTIELTSVADSRYELPPDSPLHLISPTHTRFLHDTAERQAKVEVTAEYGEGYPVPPDKIHEQQVKLAIELTGHYRLSPSGDFTAIGAGDTLYGHGNPDDVRNYLNSLGFTEIVKTYEHTENDHLDDIMPDANLALHNSPQAT